ncbi:MAG: hypothetical protein OQK12_17305 [Motiliproteus sp.]|nr:hypothetical protein [Motiliproteus sp.]MCW9051226.1 hypothetical protein [Motiliproteus sp.]
MSAGIRTESGLSTGEKNTLLNRLASAGYSQVTDIRFPKELEYTVSSYRKDPMDPQGTEAWIVKFSPV